MRTAAAILALAFPLALVSSSCTSAPDHNRDTGRRFPIEEYQLEEDDPTVIVRLESQRFHVIVTASIRGPLYTVATPDGEILLQNLTQLEMQAADPDLFDQVFGKFAHPAPAPSHDADADAENADLYPEPSATAALISADADPRQVAGLFDDAWPF